MTSVEQQARQYQRVAEAIRYIRAHAKEQPSLDELAAAVHLSKFHLQRLFSEWAGLTPKRFLQYLTKEHAKQALLTSASMLEASEAVGLSTPSRLHDLMISCEAMTPGQIKTLGKDVSIHFGYGQTPLGEALLGWCQRGLCYLAFVDQDPDVREQELFRLWPAAQYLPDPAQAQQLANRIFARQPRPGKLHLLLRGTNFQLKVWEALINIQPGQLCSYSQLAALAGSPNAQRAVGSAMAANTLAYLIPCHRVIRESGDSGHYRWGTERKLALRAWEAGQQN